MTERASSESGHPVLSGPWARRLILIDLALVLVLGWLLWTMWSDARDPKPATTIQPAASDVPSLEGLDY